MMAERVKDLMLALSEYAVVSEDATVLDALRALQESQALLPPDRQPHRAVLVRGRDGEIVGKLHHFAFLRALVPERTALSNRAILDRAGVGDDLRESSLRTLDLLTSDLVDIPQRLRHVAVTDVYSPTTHSIEEDALLLEAALRFLRYQTLSLLVTRKGKTVGILRLSDFIDELSRQSVPVDRSDDRS
jgi:CBS domain-containing protein